jgi:hypothetical protein
LSPVEQQTLIPKKSCEPKKTQTINEEMASATDVNFVSVCLKHKTSRISGFQIALLSVLTECQFLQLNGSVAPKKTVMSAWLLKFNIASPKENRLMCR